MSTEEEVDPFEAFGYHHRVGPGFVVNRPWELTVHQDIDRDTLETGVVMIVRFSQAGTNPASE